METAVQQAVDQPNDRVLDESDAELFKNIIKPADMVKERPDLYRDGQMNWWIKTRDHNGLSDAGAVFKIGHKIYLHRARFISWFLSHRESV